jgi:hypothetical protein
MEFVGFLLKIIYIRNSLIEQVLQDMNTYHGQRKGRPPMAQKQVDILTFYPVVKHLYLVDR